MSLGNRIDAELEQALGVPLNDVRLRLALESARMGAWERDLVAGRDTWSVQQEALFGLPPGGFAATHRAFLDLVHPEDRAAVEAAARRAVEGGESYHSEYRVILPDGDVRWMVGSGNVVRDADGVATHIIGVTMDVTERKKIEQERTSLLEREREAREEAETADRLKDEFLATMSHELRMPLTVILGWAQLLQQSGTDPDNLKRGLGAIERQARGMAKLVEDVLDVSRIIRGKLRLDLRPLDPAGVIAAALDALRPTAAAKGIDLTESIDPAAGFVMADPDRLQQVAWNLLSNAIKFTPRGGTVVVTLRPHAGEVEFTVRDSGVGIEPEFLPHVFERFRQADPSSRKRHGGLGLGLAIVRHLVEMHGGTVEAASDGPSTGATFTVRLPVAQTARDASDAGARPAIMASVPAGELCGLNILVVDDNADARDMIRTILSLHGADVSVAGCCQEALQALRTSKPHLLLCDLAMPEEDGFDLLRQVRQLPDCTDTRLPAAAVTARAGDEDRRRTADAGFAAHLTKPIDAEELVQAVSRLGRRAGKSGDAPVAAS